VVDPEEDDDGEFMRELDRLIELWDEQPSVEKVRRGERPWK
jgi:hypothetical protein